MSSLFFVDCEARGDSPINGQMTEFGIVHEATRNSFHGRLFEGKPDPQNPAKPLVGKRINSEKEVAQKLSKWLKEQCGRNRPIFVSDNPAYDWQWIAAMYDVAGIENPFGHSGRRISDFYAGLVRNFGNTQGWKSFRVTPHDHNPVNDSLGNVEAFQQLKELANNNKSMVVGGKKVEFNHTAVNGDMHLFINGYHNPEVCPECIEPGLLVEEI